jgi:hypothetical protein
VAEVAEPCTTPGRPGGEIQTRTLEGVLGIERTTVKEGKETRYVGVDLFPVGKTGVFMEYVCGATAPTTLSGSVIGPVPGNKMFSTGTFKHTGPVGKQQPESFEGGAKDVLTNNQGEQVGLTDSVTQTDEEALEVNAYV